MTTVGDLAYRLTTAAEMKWPLVEITQSPTTVVLSVCLAGCQAYHYHRVQFCSANSISLTHTDTHTLRFHILVGHLIDIVPSLAAYSNP